MTPACRILLAGLVALALVAGRAVADDGIPTFKKDSKRESKEFAAKVGTVIVKAARSKPQKIELKDFGYSSPKANRNELTLKMQYSGAITKVKFSVDIVVILDTTDKERWEVLNIRYKDSNRSPVPFSVKKVQELVKQFNR